MKWGWGWKDLEEWIWFLNSPYSPYVNFHENLRKKTDPFFKTFLTNRGKNEIVNEKIWENEFDLWILHIKVRLYGNFHENLWKKNFDQFFRTLLTNRGKNEIEDEKYEKMNLIFEFSISKLGYVDVFREISEKNLEKWVQFLNSSYQN